MTVEYMSMSPEIYIQHNDSGKFIYFSLNISKTVKLTEKVTEHKIHGSFLFIIFVQNSLPLNKYLVAYA
jgi:hypothetical protein